jgi:hypothetical protein
VICERVNHPEDGDKRRNSIKIEKLSAKMACKNGRSITAGRGLGAREDMKSKETLDTGRGMCVVLIGRSELSY